MQKAHQNSARFCLTAHDSADVGLTGNLLSMRFNNDFFIVKKNGWNDQAQRIRSNNEEMFADLNELNSAKLARSLSILLERNQSAICFIPECQPGQTKTLQKTNSLGFL